MFRSSNLLVSKSVFFFFFLLLIFNFVIFPAVAFCYLLDLIRFPWQFFVEILSQFALFSRIQIFFEIYSKKFWNFYVFWNLPNHARKGNLVVYRCCCLLFKRVFKLFPHYFVRFFFTKICPCIKFFVFFEFLYLQPQICCRTAELLGTPTVNSKILPPQIALIATFSSKRKIFFKLLFLDVVVSFGGFFKILNFEHFQILDNYIFCKNSVNSVSGNLCSLLEFFFKHNVSLI